MEFSWKNFMSRYGITERNADRRWGEILPSLTGSRVPAGRLLCLAYFDGIDRSIHECNVEYLSRIAQRFSFVYYDLYAANSKTEEDLRLLGIELLRSKNGDRQFVRTIRRYSGSMYVRMAHTISNIVRSSSWNRVMEPGYLDNNELLRSQLDLYLGDSDEDVQTKKDIVVFFQTLSRLYRKYNKPFTKDDIQELAPLTPGVSQRIIDEMCSVDTAGDVSLRELDTLPTIDLTLDGVTVFRLPEIGHFGHDVEHVNYMFKESTAASESIAFANYRKRQDGTFVLEWEDGFQDGVPLAGVGAIVRRRNAVRDDGLSSDAKTVEEDVMPLYLKDSTKDSILICIKGIETGCGYALDQGRGNDGIVTSTTKLAPGRYKAVSFRGILPELHFLKNESVIDIDSALEAEYLHDGIFTVPVGVDAVKVGNCLYICENECSKYFDVDSRAQIIKNPGSRLFFYDGEYPFTEYFENVAATSNVKILYVSPNQQEEIELPISGIDWEIPEECLWKRGWIEFLIDSEIKYRRAVTFIQEPISESLNKRWDIEMSLELEVRIGAEMVKAQADKWDTELRVEYRGFVLSIPILRKGVYFECGERAIPIRCEPPGKRCVTYIAVRDFERTCTVLTDNDSIICVTRGSDAISIMDRHSFSGTELMSISSLKNETSNFFCICVGSPDAMEYYKFRVYDPSREYSDPECRSRVFTKRLKDDLQLTYCVATVDAGVKKSIAYYPAHRQEEEIQWIEPDENNSVSWKYDCFMRCIETLTIKDFYCRDIDWGDGLLCYVGRKMPTPNRLKFTIESFTAGFFLPRPMEVIGDMSFGEDPFGLRAAMAKKDHVKLEQIMVSAKSDCTLREYIGGEEGFLRKLQLESARIHSVPKLGHSENGRNFMNAYRNLLVRKDSGREISGYVFMAGWYYAAKVKSDKKRRMPEGLRELWSPLMLSWKDLSEAQLLPPPVQLILPTCSQIDYMPLREKKEFRTLIERVTKHPCMRHGNCMYYERGFNYIRFSEAMRDAIQHGTKFQELLARVSNPGRCGFAIKMLWAMYKAWYDVLSKRIDLREILKRRFSDQEVERYLRTTPSPGQAAVIRIALGKYKSVPYPVSGGYDMGLVYPCRDQQCDKHIADSDVTRFIEKVTDDLVNWRENPSIVGGQDLRDVLLKISKLDETIARLFSDGTLSLAGGSVPSMTRYIDYMAWQRYKAKLCQIQN